MKEIKTFLKIARGQRIEQNIVKEREYVSIPAKTYREPLELRSKLRYVIKFAQAKFLCRSFEDAQAYLAVPQ